MFEGIKTERTRFGLTDTATTKYKQRASAMLQAHDGTFRTRQGPIVINRLYKPSRYGNAAKRARLSPIVVVRAYILRPERVRTHVIFNNNNSCALWPVALSGTRGVYLINNKPAAASRTRVWLGDITTTTTDDINIESSHKWYYTGRTCRCGFTTTVLRSYIYIYIYDG